MCDFRLVTGCLFFIVLLLFLDHAIIKDNQNLPEKTMILHKTMLECIGRADKWTTLRTNAVFGDDSPESRKIKRRFKINAAAELVGVSRQSIERAEKDGRLPPADYVDSRGANPRPIRAGYTLEQIDHMREVFGTHPFKPDDQRGVTLCVAGGKGGCYKTSSVAHLSQWLSLRGYRVLVIDIDPQSHLSMYFGYHPELNTTIEQTVLPFMLGEQDSLYYAIHPTAWPHLDVIPSHLHMQRLERELPIADQEGRLEYPINQMLQAGIDEIAHAYDVILIDGHPDLGLGTTNMICASDVTLIATSAEVNDINSSKQLMQLVADLYAPDSLVETTHEPSVRVLVTKIGAVSSSSEKNMRDINGIWPGLPLVNGVRVTDEVGKGQRRMATVYEQVDDQRSSPSAWKRAVEIFDPVFNEILTEVIKPYWGDEE